MSEKLSNYKREDFKSYKYDTAEEVAAALSWAISNLGATGDNTRSFEMLLEVMKVRPALIVDIVKASIVAARENLGQEREGKVPAAMLGTIDAAIKVVGHQKGLFKGEDAFSIDNWTNEILIEVLSQYSPEIIALAGENTTSKNIPHRAAYILWLIDQCPDIPQNPSFSFVELGSSGGLILDALKSPHTFATWMKNNGQDLDIARKFSPTDVNQTLGVDLVIPSTDWLKALILTDSDRAEIIDFINQFERSNLIEGDATNLQNLAPVTAYFDQNRDKIPFIFSTSMFYQITAAQRDTILVSARKMLQDLGGGYILIADSGINRGFPDIERNVAWIENEKGQVLSPRIKTVNQNGTKWEVI